MLQPSQDLSRSHKVEVTIIAKALPQVGDKHGETVCVAAMDDRRNWYRLYPVPFRQLENGQKFVRWDKVSATCRLVSPGRDRRQESRTVEQNSLAVLGNLSAARRTEFIEKAIVRSTKREYAEGRSLALIRPSNPRFFFRERSADAIATRQAAYARLARQPDIWGTAPLKPLPIAPYEFGYRYDDDDGPHECLCHDWEVEQTYINWERQYGRERTLEEMVRRYGTDYPRDGMVFAMGTHSAYPKQWMIIGVVKMRPSPQASLF